MKYMALMYVTMVTNFAPVLLYMFKKAGRQPEIRYILPFISLIAFSTFYEFVFSVILRVDNFIWFWVYSLLEFLCILYFFIKIFRGKYKQLFNTFLIAFVACFTFFTVLWITEGYVRRDSYLAIFETLLVYIAAILWFKGIFDELALKSLWESPVFYFISGFILYFSGTLFLFLMADFALTTKETAKFWVINILLSLILNFILFIGIWKGQHKSIRYSG